MNRSIIYYLSIFNIYKKTHFTTIINFLISIKVKIIYLKKKHSFTSIQYISRKLLTEFYDSFQEKNPLKYINLSLAPNINYEKLTLFLRLL